MKRILFVILSLFALTIQAQTEAPAESTDTIANQIRFGYLSYDAALKSMPEYEATLDSVARLREAYQKEIQRVEDDFNQKYELFLEGQKEFPKTILLKRQNELKALMQHNIEFKAQAREELQKAEVDVFIPLKQRLNSVLASIAKEYRFALVINTDANACPFIDPTMGMDIQQMVEDYLK